MSSTTLPVPVDVTLPIRMAPPMCTVWEGRIQLYGFLRADLMQHLQRIYAGGETRQVVLQPNLAAITINADGSSAIVAPPLVDHSLFRDAAGVKDLHKLIRALTPPRPPEYLFFGHDEEGRQWFVGYPERPPGRVQSCEPARITTHAAADEVYRYLGYLAAVDAWTFLSKDVIRWVLWAQGAYGMDVRLHVTPAGTELRVGSKKTRVPYSLGNLSGDGDYTLLLRGHTVRRLLAHLKKEKEAWIAVTGPDSIVGICVPTPRGPYTYLINPLNK